jgi:hypothetical protein
MELLEQKEIKEMVWRFIYVKAITLMENYKAAYILW